MVKQKSNEKWRDISGNYYDWKKNLLPEKPYNHKYHEVLTMKMLLSVHDDKGDTQIIIDFNQALDIVKKINNLTRNVKKIIYMVGWQYSGHDDKYPAFFEVNKGLKRKEDESARDSFIWFAEECKKYNTLISVHINLTDAYKDSPLWDDYIENNLISKKKNGDLKKIGVWNRRTAYQICYKYEWERGFLTKRINKLIDLLPFIQSNGTIHADAYFARSNPYEKISQEVEESYMRRVYRYFRFLGIDLTSEFQSTHKKDRFIGLQPMAWHFDQRIKDFMKIPAYLACGGRPNPDMVIEKIRTIDVGFLFGENVHGEQCFSNKDENGKFQLNHNWESCFKDEFFLEGLQFLYLNKFNRLHLKKRLSSKILEYSDNLTVIQKTKEIIHKGCILRNNNDIFFPILWNENEKREIIAYSKDGYKERKWILPKNWENGEYVSISEITTDGLKLISDNVKINNQEILLSLKPKQAISIKLFS